MAGWLVRPQVELPPTWPELAGTELRVDVELQDVEDDSYHFQILIMASSELTWINVVVSLVAFILFDIGVSTVFRLGIGLSLLIAGLQSYDALVN